MKIFSFDCESIGLRGDIFAVGYTVIEEERQTGAFKEIECGWLSMGIDTSIAIRRTAESLGISPCRTILPEDVEWLKINIAEDVQEMSPELGKVIPLVYANMCNWFLEAAKRYEKEGAIFVVDCGIPIEARWLESI